MQPNLENCTSNNIGYIDPRKCQIFNQADLVSLTSVILSHLPDNELTKNKIIDSLETLILNKMQMVNSDLIIEIFSIFLSYPNIVCMSLLEELEKMFLDNSISELSPLQTSI